jgi:hypothetical protein
VPGFILCIIGVIFCGSVEAAYSVIQTGLQRFVVIALVDVQNTDNIAIGVLCDVIYRITNCPLL